MGAIFIRAFTVFVVGALSLLVLRVLVRGDKPIGFDFLDTRTYRFDTMADISPRLLEGGRIPAEMPICASNIYLEFNIDTSERVIAFDCANPEARSEFVENLRQLETDYVEVSGKEVVVESL